ncbi:receptor-like protein EIX2 [Actinidia eriantha]|uniref:receptor-like protein EIX2 n=1 Tax=Actinidia eriantha TaxID=165200 RepID=UPI002588482E|nr:receptor-like protein EIX2 [Actinidia eriantha]
MVIKMLIGEKPIQLLHVFVVLLLVCNKLALGLTSDAKIRCIEREKQALLKFKETLIDDYGVLSSWGSEELKKDCCKWRGVRCNNHTGHVTKLDLRASFLSLDGLYQPLSGKISPSLLELQHLTYLDLSGNSFEGNYYPIPHHLGNFSNLRYLALGGNYFLNGGNLEWLSHFPLLRHLDLDMIDLSQAINWVESISNLPLLKTLNLSQCKLPNVLRSTRVFNSSLSLAVLDLSFNSFSSSIYNWLFNLSSSLVHVDLQDNYLNGSVPDAFGNMVSLEYLNLAYNQFEGGLPKSFANLSHLQSLVLRLTNLTEELSEIFQKLYGSKKSLQFLDLEGNQLSGTLPDFTRFSSLRELYLGDNQLVGPLPKSFVQILPSFVSLKMSGNQITGMFPDLSAFPSLTRLDLSNNKLNGSVTKTIGQLSNLEYLDASLNSLEGVISEAHFSNLLSLNYLDLSFNPLVLNISSNWIHPFNLDIIRLRSCKLGPYFPKWLQNQNNFSELDISGAGISDVVPSWFWDLPPSLTYLTISYNQMNGLLPDLSLKISGHPTLDLSSNRFMGQIPRVPSNVTSLILSKNMFSGSISFLCAITGFELTYLDLSSNRLYGGLPDCWERFEELRVMNLANNNLSGKLPRSMGSLYRIRALQLRNNNFSGELPMSLKKCVDLRIIDLGGNKFTGKIQAWIGTHLTSLNVLSLKSNKFHGSIPQHICHLNNIQVLDFSQNDLSGKLPRCFNNFSALIQRSSLDSEDTIDFHCQWHFF